MPENDDIHSVNDILKSPDNINRMKEMFKDIAKAQAQSAGYEQCMICKKMVRRFDYNVFDKDVGMIKLCEECTAYAIIKYYQQMNGLFD